MNNEGEKFYKTGKSYDLSQDVSPAYGMLAKAAFQQGASLGHTGCLRGLAGMLHFGVGGKKDSAEAMKILWIAHLKNDPEALPELADMLEELAEVDPDSANRVRLRNAAENSRQIGNMTAAMHEFLQGNQMQKTLGNEP